MPPGWYKRGGTARTDISLKLLPHYEVDIDGGFLGHCHYTYCDSQKGRNYSNDPITLSLTVNHFQLTTTFLLGSKSTESIDFIQDQVYPLYYEFRDLVHFVFVPFGRANSVRIIEIVI